MLDCVMVCLIKVISENGRHCQSKGDIVRAKAEVRAEARREGESLGLSRPELVQHIIEEVELFIAMEKERGERDMVKEAAEREHALRVLELEIEREKVKKEKTESPGRSLVLDSRTGQVHQSLLFPLDPFDKKICILLS